MLRAAVVGTGFVGPAHVEALKSIQARVVGLVGSSPERARQKAAELGVERAYESFEAMLADPTVDVVHIATPNYLHFPQAKAALLAGKHVVCEKPLTMNTVESAELVRLAAQTGLVNAVCFNLRYYPMVPRAREVVRSGNLGELFIVHGQYLQDWLLSPTVWNWRVEPAVGGSLRTVTDIGSHWLDMVTFVTGLRTVEVMADLGTFVPTRIKPEGPVQTFARVASAAGCTEQPVHTEDYASILLHLEHGVRGVLTVSQVSAGRKNRLTFEVNGAMSSVAWGSERPDELWIGHGNQDNEQLLKDPSLLAAPEQALTSRPAGHNDGYHETFRQLFRQVYDYIASGHRAARPDFPTFLDGHDVLTVCEAIEQSARCGQWVRVPSTEVQG